MNAQNKPNKLIKGATGDWEVVIGMEVHAQVASNRDLWLQQSDHAARGVSRDLRNS